MEKSNSDFRLVSFIAILILIIIPLGSNTRLSNSVYGMWIPMPICFAYIFRLRKASTEFITESDSGSTQWSVRLNSDELRLFRNILVTSFVIFSLVWSYMFTYVDSPKRIEMRYSVDSPRLRGIFTTKERARVVQVLIDEVNKYVHEDDYMLAYNEIPMLYFLTKTRPYLYNSWPEGSPTHQFKQMVDRAMKEKAQLPVAVMAKFNTSWDYWPAIKSPLADDSTKTENRNIIENFLKNNMYSIVWENDFFRILTSSKSKVVPMNKINN
jgi:hypothetical protein